MRVVVEGGLELGHVEALLLGVLVERLALQAVFFGLIREELVVHFPEAFVALLLQGLFRGLAGEGRVRVHREGLVAPNELHLVAVVLHDFVYLRLDARAEGALEIRELLDDDLRVRLALEGRARGGSREVLLLGIGRAFSVLDDRVVEVLRRGALLEHLVGLLDLFVDDLLELVERLRTDEAATVDEHVRGAAGLHVVGELGVGVDLALVLVRLDRVFDLVDVELHVRGDLLEVGVLELGLRIEEAIVSFPEARITLLGARFEGHFRGRLGARVERQGLVLPHDADLVAVLVADLLERGLHALAVGALEVREDRDGDLRVLVALDGRRADGDLEDRRRVFLLFFLFLGRRRSVLFVLLRHLDVDAVLGGAGGDLRLGLAELLVDRLFELVEGLRAGEADAVDVECRRSVDAGLLGDLVVLVDLLRPLVRSNAGLESGHVDASVFGPLLVALGRERLLVLERGVVELPERFAALERKNALSGFGGGLRFVVERERLVFPDETNLVGTVGGLDLVEGGLDARAERALEVREDDDRDRCFALAPHGVFARNRDGRLFVAPGGAACGGALGADRAALLHAVVVVSPHHAGAGDEAENEPDDGCAGIHTAAAGFERVRGRRSLRVLLFFFGHVQFSFGFVTKRTEAPSSPRAIGQGVEWNAPPSWFWASEPGPCGGRAKPQGTQVD